MAYRVCAGCGEAYDDRRQATHLTSREHRRWVIQQQAAKAARKATEG